MEAEERAQHPHRVNEGVGQALSTTSIAEGVGDCVQVDRGGGGGGNKPLTAVSCKPLYLQGVGLINH